MMSTVSHIPTFSSGERPIVAVVYAVHYEMQTRTGLRNSGLPLTNHVNARGRDIR